MIKVGITGGIGSGKSIVSKAFAMLGVPTYNADKRAKAIIHENAAVKTAIISLLGADAYQDGFYNRNYVAELVFSDAELLKKLNEIVHPAVRKDSVDWFTENANCQYVIYEAAIMNAAGNKNSLDYVIAINADVETRIRRILKRDLHRTSNQIAEIIDKQNSAEEFQEIADFVIQNNDNDLIMEQVLHLHKRFLEEI